MDITVKTKFDKGDKVIVKTTDGAEKLVVFVLAKVLDVKQIVRLTAGFNKIAYDVRTYKIDDCHSRDILVEEGQMYSLEEFTKLFNAIHN